MPIDKRITGLSAEVTLRRAATNGERHVAVVGDFNDWSPQHHPMTGGPAGCRRSDRARRWPPGGSSLVAAGQLSVAAVRWSRGARVQAGLGQRVGGRHWSIDLLDDVVALWSGACRSFDASAECATLVGGRIRVRVGVDRADDDVEWCRLDVHEDRRQPSQLRRA